MDFKVKSLCGVVVFAGFSVAIAGQDRAVDYTQWRGPNRDGEAASFAAPTVWPERLTQKWKVQVGLGYATPSFAAAQRPSSWCVATRLRSLRRGRSRPYPETGYS
jgi:hypothetical protein